MKIVEMTTTEFESIQTSGTSLKTAKAKDLPAGIYDVVELKDVKTKSKEEVIANLIEYYGEEPKWAENLPESNVSGFCRLKNGDKNVSVYLNNALFNLMVEGKALERKQKGNKVSVSLTGKPFKI